MFEIKGIFFSLLVCTLNREKELLKCIKSLTNQSFKNYEIIIVDQSEYYNKSFIGCEKIKYIHINKKGLSNARNEGLSLCEGNWIALMDDDAIYDPDFLSHAAEFINNRNEQVGIISGVGYDKENNQYLISSMKTKDIKKVSWSSIFKYCISAGMIIRSDILLKYGFDTNFGVGSGTIFGSSEESDIVIETLKMNENIFFYPKMIFYHKSDINSSFDKIYSYSCGHGGLLKKHYLLTKNPLFLLIFVTSLFRSVIGCVLYCFGIKKYKKSLYTLKGKIHGFFMYDNKFG